MQKNRKKTLIIILSISIICGVIYTCYSIFSKPKININQLPGKIIFGREIGSTENNGICIFQPKNKSLTAILEGDYYTYVDLDNRKDRFLTIKRMQDADTYKDVICEYSFIDKKLTQIMPEKSIGNPGLLYVKYVPGTDEISYIWGNKLYIYNKLSKIETYIVDVNSNYCWSNDGKVLFYCKPYTNQIFKYYLGERKEELLFQGDSPEISLDSKYLGYIDDKNNTLIVKEMSTDKEWRYKTDSSIVFFKFSPDDNYILFLQGSKSNIFAASSHLKVLKFRTGDTINLFNDAYFGRTFDWK
ncbi:MAG: hypothetical protein Q8920_09465 [Bacillota bacterium]|nr:hypothetical protein [Bacillota bacterium]